MRNTNKIACRGVKPLLAFLMSTAAIVPAHAADPDASSAPDSETERNSRSESAVVNLIDILVSQGVLDSDQAEALLRQANEEAAAAQAAEEEEDTSTVVAPTAAPSEDGSVRVTYVPDAVRNQIKEEVKSDVVAQARTENWAAPNTFPEWVSRIRFKGDVRARYEGVNFPAGNDNTGTHVDFNAINTGSPYDVSEENVEFYPTLNVDQDRDRYRLRARLGLEADLGDGFVSGLRIATGSDSSPVSVNQTLGRNGGNFSKYEIWLDRAFIGYKPDLGEKAGLLVQVGRFANPFFGTELVWDDDLGFDGAALAAEYDVGWGISPYVTAGAFPIFNTALNFASTNPAKFESHDKYLYAAQGGFEWHFFKDFTLKAGAAYYKFQNVEGELSSPCTILSANDACDTDATRPSFAQKGNSYMALRNIVANADNDFGTINQFQYFGLATRFKPVAFTGRVDFDGLPYARVSLFGEYVKNRAFDAERLEQNALNNRGPIGEDEDIGAFDGGDTGYMFGMIVGKPDLAKLGDWTVEVNYRHLESDAVVDAFTDSNFGLGGTNLEGYTLAGKFALNSRVGTRLRWMSADSIAGTPYSVDVLQFDINARF